MFPLSTIRRRLLLCAGSLLVISGLSVTVVHTGMVRRFVLVQIQIRLGNATGLRLNAKDLEYNLFSSRYELKDVALMGARLADVPAPVRVERMQLMLPLWRLIRGQFDTAQIRIDGLSVRWITGRDGKSNLPPLNGLTSAGESAGGKGAKTPMTGGPSILITSGELYLQDDRNGLFLQLPIKRLSGEWDAASRQYGIVCDGAGGRANWKDARLPLDGLQLKSAIKDAGFSIESLRLRSGGSEMQVTGLLSGSRIVAGADLNLEMRELSQALAPGIPARGRLQAHLSATGLLEALEVKAGLAGQDLAIGGISLRRPALEAVVNTATGEVRIGRLSVEALGGQLIASGRLQTGSSSRPSELTVGLNHVDLRQMARLFGSQNVPPGRVALEVTASWPGLNWRRAAVSGAVRSQSARAAFTATGASQSLAASFDSSLGDGAKMHGDITYGVANHAVAGTMRGTINSLAQFGIQAESFLDRPASSLNPQAIDGSVHWYAAVGGTTALPTASFQVEGNDLSIGAWNGAAIQMAANYDADHITIDRVHVEWRGQQIDMKGEIGGVSADAPLSLDGTIKSESVAEVLDHLGAAHSIEAAVSGGFRLSGSIASLVAETNLHAGSLTAYGESVSRASLDARWQDGELNLSRLAFDQDHPSGAPGHFEASGSLTPATGRYVIKAAGRDLQPTTVVLPGDRRLTGNFQFDTHGEGTLGDPIFSVQLDGSDVKVGEISIGELNAKVDAADHHATALLAAPVLDAKVTSNITMEGAWPFELNLASTNTRLETVPATSFGAALHAAGTLAPARVEQVTAAVHNFRLATPGQEVVGDGPIDLSYADGRVRVGHLALKSGDSALRLSGEMPLDDASPAGSLSLQGVLNLESFSQLLGGAGSAQINGVAEVNATLTGSAQKSRPAASVTIHDGRFRYKPIPFPIEDINGKLTVEDEVIRLDGVGGKAATGTLRIDGSLPLRLISAALPAPAVEPDQPARFSARIDKLELSNGSGEQRATVKAGVKLEGEASALSLPAVRASLEFNGLAAKSKNSEMAQVGPTRITIDGGIARLDHLDFRGGAGGSLKAAGAVGLTGSFPLQLEASGKIDLAVLSAVVAPLEAAGAVQLDVRVGGTISAPQITGFVELHKANLVLPEPPIQAANIELRADLNKDHITVTQFTGNLNGGSFNAGGDLKVGSGGVRDVNLFLKGTDVFTEYPGAVKSVSTLDLKFVSQGKRLVLDGQIDVQEGYYEAALDIFSRSEQTLDTGQEGPPDSTSNPVAFDIRIVTKRPVEMDNNLGRLSANADLRLAGNIRRVGLVGTAELEQDGKLYFGDRTYYIERGTVRFADDSHINPVFNIQAYTRTNDYTIRLGLTGPLKELTTTFTSDPPLSRDDVIAVLLTGKTVADNRGVDLRALEATSLATGALNASLSSSLHRAIGVSRVSVQPGAVAAESNNPGTRITITQDFTESLRMLYSMNLNDSNDQIWVTEYDLSRRFTTRAVKQSDNTYRGEFRHDIRFGGSSGGDSTASRPAGRKISEVRFTGADAFTPDALAKIFKVKPGREYKSIKVRKGTERLSKFFMKKGYLENRVRLDRDDSGQGIGLTVRIELGSVVELAYQGANLPKKQKSRVRDAWHAGISDQQRPRASKEAILSYFTQKGYPQAKADVHLARDGDRKLVRFDLTPGIRYRGVKILVEGVEPTRKQEILELVHERPMRLALYRNPAGVVEALTRYYEQRGYLTAKVEPPVQRLDSERRTGQIVIPIEEGPLFHVGAFNFSGNQVLSADDLRSGVPLEAGGVFEPGRLEPTVAALKLKYGKLGYRDTRVEFGLIRHDDSALIDVSFTVAENKQTSIGAISVEGNRHTSASFARRQLKVGEGEVANTELIRESLKNLSQTGAYGAADIHVGPPAPSGAGDKPVQVADLVVAVSEPKPFRLLYGGLYDSGNGPGFIADFQNHNSLGSGRVVGLRARYDSETNEARLYLTQPTWNSNRISTTISTYFTREEEYLQTTPTDKLGASIQQDIQLRSKLLLSYGYRYERQRGFVPDPAVPPPIPQTVVTVAPLTLTLSRDTRDSFLEATRGSFISHGFEIAPGFLGSDYPYARYYGQYFKYFALTRPRPVPYGEKAKPSRLVFATGSRLGVQKGFNETGAVLTDRFYAGGGTTVRGFRQDELGPKLENGQPAGGNAVLILNEELRYPLFWIFDAVTFVDIGNVFPRVSDFRLSQLRSAGGFGLRIRNPFVVLRFDYGFKFDRRPGESAGAFFFSIGQAF